MLSGRKGPGTCKEGSLLFTWRAKGFWEKLSSFHTFFMLYSYILLETFHLETLKSIQSLPTRTANSIVYLLLGALPLKAEVEKGKLNYFNRF